MPSSLLSDMVMFFDYTIFETKKKRILYKYQSNKVLL